jgi:hypothetical protein
LPRLFSTVYLFAEVTTHRIPTFAKAKPDAPVAQQKKETGTRTSKLEMNEPIVETTRKLLAYTRC